jgi:CRP-like cAMP-binding protein
VSLSPSLTRAVTVYGVPVAQRKALLGIALLWSRPRTASVRARTPCDLFVLGKADLDHLLKDFPQFAGSIREAARRRYGVDPGAGR